MREHFENLRFAPLVLAGNLSSPHRREVPAAVLLAEARGNKEKVANAGGDSAYVHEKKLALCAAGPGFKGSRDGFGGIPQRCPRRCCSAFQVMWSNRRLWSS